MMLTVEHISFAFRNDRMILEDICASAEPGRVTAMIGPNAAGKTTLLRLLAGVLLPLEGVIRLAGKPLLEYDGPSRARRLAYVAQRPIVDAPFRVLDVLKLGAFPTVARAGAKSLRLDWIIERCELRNLVGTMFHELSVGQQQRVALARALVQLNGGGENTTLLLDEPMSAMDPQHIEQTGRLLREMAERGTTVLIVLHDLGLAGLLADDVWALDGGRLRAAGPIGTTLDVAMLEEIYGCRFQLQGAGSTAVPEPDYQFKK